VLKVVKQCVGWLDWKFVAGGLAVLIAVAVCAKLPTLKIFAGAAPLLLLAVCLVPCLLPLAWLRNARRGEATKAQVPEDDREGYTPQE
jgi:hypothetical protein